MKLVLLRHGESEWNKANRFTGWTDVDLSEKGVEEAKKAGISLKEIDIAAYYPADGTRISHFRLFKDNVKLSRLNAKLFFRSLIPLPHKRLHPTGKGMDE